MRDDYFRAMGIPLKSRRFFTPDEQPRAPREVIVSETTARLYWPGLDPVGTRLKWGLKGSPIPWLTVVGIVGDVKSGPLDKETQPQTYEPSRQTARSTWLVVVRAGRDPVGLASAVRAEMRALDPEQPVTKVRTMEQVVRQSTAPRRFHTFLLTAFAAAALLLAALGLYGVLAGLLYGVRPHDALTFATVSVLLAGVGLAVTYLPARRAPRVNPVAALRYE